MVRGLWPTLLITPKLTKEVTFKWTEELLCRCVCIVSCWIPTGGLQIKRNPNDSKRNPKSKRGEEVSGRDHRPH